MQQNMLGDRKDAHVVGLTRPASTFQEGLATALFLPGKAGQRPRNKGGLS
jgi:hypothetical protein